MALVAYICDRCSRKALAFRGEEHRLTLRCEVGCEISPLPPNPVTVHTTDTFMSEPQLDSLSSLYELDRLLTIEAREEKELFVFNEFRRNS